jgi:RNA 2',3'-cyclic 3'-phosphodiesterase
MKRTFIAIEVAASAKLKQEYELIRYRLRLEKINWVPVENLHITLNFLGDTEEEILPEMIRSIESTADRHAPIDIVLRSFGVFKNIREPRVIWINCIFDPELGQVKKELDHGLSLFGFEPDKREFSPHLTLGRVKEIRQLNQLTQLIALYKEFEFQRLQVINLVLFESILRPEGPEYIPIRVFPFQNQSPLPSH